MPKAFSGANKREITLYLSAPLLTALDRVSAQYGMSRAQFIRQALSDATQTPCQS